MKGVEARFGGGIDGCFDPVALLSSAVAEDDDADGCAGDTWLKGWWECDCWCR